jgi:hypothetical protein
MEELLKNMVNGMSNMDNVPPDMLLKARQLINTPKGRAVLKDLEKQGITQESIGKLIQSTQPPKKMGLLIRQNGIIKSKVITETPLEGSDPQCINVVINNINVYAWYDAKNKCVNKKASKLLNMTVGGQVVLYADIDLTVDMIKLI